MMEKRIFTKTAAAFAVLLFCLAAAAPAKADPSIYTLSKISELGLAPDGSHVVFLQYYTHMSPHSLDNYYLCLMTAQELEDLRKEAQKIQDSNYHYDELYELVELSEFSVSNVPREPAHFYAHEEAWDTGYGIWLSHDGTELQLNSSFADIYDGSGTSTITVMKWTDEGYAVISTRENENGVEAVLQAIRQAHHPHAVLESFESLEEIGGKAGQLWKYPPDELLLPLWHFFRYQDDGNYLADFLDKACFDCKLEDFLQASLAMPGVREHMEASAVILRRQQKTGWAKMLEEVLEDTQNGQ